MQASSQPPSRLWLLDLIRGAALLLMVVFHVAFDLDYFLKSTYTQSVMMATIGRTALVLFLVVTGASGYFRFYKLTDAGASQVAIQVAFLRRGLVLFTWGMVVTLASLLFDPQTYIRFGVLHLIGVSTMLMPFMIPNRVVTMVTTVGALVAGTIISLQTVSFPWLLWLGFLPKGFVSIDYVPLLPYFGIVCLGMLLGRGVYADYQQGIFGSIPRFWPIRGVSWFGSHSLFVYLIHQPILVALLAAVL